MRTIKKIDSWDEFKANFDPSVHAILDAKLAEPGVTAMVMFENLQMDAVAFGRRTAMIVGPGCSHGSVKECEGRWLNDLPSQRQYPTAYYSKPKDGENEE